MTKETESIAEILRRTFGADDIVANGCAARIIAARPSPDAGLVEREAHARIAETMFDCGEALHAGKQIASVILSHRGANVSADTKLLREMIRDGYPVDDIYNQCDLIDAALLAGSPNSGVNVAGEAVASHLYSPDYQAMGDCRVCGHGQNAAHHATPTPAAGEAVAHDPETYAREEAETYDVGHRDGYEEAIQQIDVATGGDGDFRDSTFPGETVDVSAMKRRIIVRLAPAPAGRDPYRDIIDEALVIRHLGVSSGDARADFNRVMDWEIDVVLDPRVSCRAQALIDQGRTAGRDPATIESCAKVAKQVADIERAGDQWRLGFASGAENAANRIRALAAPAIVTEER